jgi:hypothetical protein
MVGSKEDKKLLEPLLEAESTRVRKKAREAIKILDSRT